MSKVLNYLASIPNDKLLHIFYGVLIYLVAALISPVFGVIAVVVIAIAKEVYDEIVYGGFDWKDIIATILIPMMLFIKEF